MPLNPAAQAALAALTRLRPDPRAGYKAVRATEGAAAALGFASPRCRIEDAICKARDGYEIPLRVFTPQEIGYSTKGGLHVDEDCGGTILFFHGGGWAVGDVELYSDCCTRMAVHLGRRIVSVEYRRSPEYVFPTALNDCFDVTRSIHYGVLFPETDWENVVLCGDSAGGNLAAAVALKARDLDLFTVHQQILLYPLLYNDHSDACIFDSLQENGQGYLLTQRDIESYVEMYVPNAQDRQSPYFAPLLAGDLSGMPRTLVITAEYCPLRDEGEVFAAQINHDGGDATAARMLKGFHGYFLAPSLSALVRDTLMVMKNFLDCDPLPQRSNPSWLFLVGKES